MPLIRQRPDAVLTPARGQVALCCNMGVEIIKLLLFKFVRMFVTFPIGSHMLSSLVSSP